MTDKTMPIGAQLRCVAERQPDDIAITCDDQTITYRELEASTNRLARAYQQVGVGLGDYVTIALPNSIEWIQAAFAIWKLGAIPQPLSARLPDAEMEELLALVPRALIVGRNDVHGAVPSLPSGFKPDSWLSDAPLPDAVSPSWKAVGSGGSTGRPKLIEATGDSCLPTTAFGGLLGLRAGETQLVPGPLTHNTPIVMSVLGLLLGQHLVLMRRFDPLRFLQLIAEHQVEFVATVPTVMQRTLPVYRENPDAHVLSSIRRMWHMAAPCPAEVKRAWIDILGPEKVWELYAGTELQAMTFVSGEEWLTHSGTVGRVVTGEMKILDDDGNECPPGRIGDIYMRPDVGSGPTYRYIGSVPSSRDGWDTIGDLGHFDEEGFLYLSDRRVDMFNVGGRKVYPAEIENALAGHSEVLSSIVVGVPDDDLGHVPYALVQLTVGSALSADQICDYLRERIAAYKIPCEVEFRSAPLRDDAGKARRSAIRTEVIARLCGRSQASSNGVASQ